MIKEETSRKEMPEHQRDSLGSLETQHTQIESTMILVRGKEELRPSLDAPSTYRQSIDSERCHSGSTD